MYTGFRHMSDFRFQGFWPFNSAQCDDISAAFRACYPPNRNPSVPGVDNTVGHGIKWTRGTENAVERTERKGGKDPDPIQTMHAKLV